MIAREELRDGILWIGDNRSCSGISDDSDKPEEEEKTEDFKNRIYMWWNEADIITDQQNISIEYWTFIVEKLFFLFSIYSSYDEFYNFSKLLFFNEFPWTTK